MSLIDDGDLIRGLGFVVLYAAYLEEAIDECLMVVADHDAEYDQRINYRSTKQKIKYIKGQLLKLEPLPNELMNFPEVLSGADCLLEMRNLMIHGRIYATHNKGDIRISGRQNVPETPANSPELYALANELYSACSPLQSASTFSLPREYALLRTIGG